MLDRLTEPFIPAIESGDMKAWYGSIVGKGFIELGDISFFIFFNIRGVVESASTFIFIALVLVL